jgi:hypothetical protein
MSNQVYAFALKNTLKEIKNVCPDVTNAFIFEENNNTLAKDDETPEKTINKTIGAFNAITERAETIGGLETVTIQGAEGKVTIACTNDFYLTTVASKEADEKYVNALTQVLIPTVIKLVDELQPAATDEEAVTETEPPEPEQEEEAVETEEAEEAETLEPEEEEAPYETDFPQETDPEEAAAEETEEPEETEAEPYEPFEPEPEEPEEENGLLIPEPPVTQLIVENLGGLLVPSDTVRVDNGLISQWNDLYGDKKLQEVDLEALNGRTTRCKFKNIKDSKYQGKGIIQIPEKIQTILETAKGELVMVKPVVD